MDIKNRIEKLERHKGRGKPQVTLYVLYDGERIPSKADRDAELERYKAKFPDWQTKDIIVLGIGIHEATDDQLVQVITGDPDSKAGDISTAGLEAIARGDQ